MSPGTVVWAPPPTSSYTQSWLCPHPIGPAYRGKRMSPAWPPPVATVTGRPHSPGEGRHCDANVGGVAEVGVGVRFNSHLPERNRCHAQPQTVKSCLPPLGQPAPHPSPLPFPKHPGSSAPFLSGPSHLLPRILEGGGAVLRVQAPSHRLLGDLPASHPLVPGPKPLASWELSKGMWADAPGDGAPAPLRPTHKAPL